MRHHLLISLRPTDSLSSFLAFMSLKYFRILTLCSLSTANTMVWASVICLMKHWIELAFSHNHPYSQDLVWLFKNTCVHVIPCSESMDDFSLLLGIKSNIPVPGLWDPALPEPSSLSSSSHSDLLSDCHEQYIPANSKLSSSPPHNSPPPVMSPTISNPNLTHPSGLSLHISFSRRPSFPWFLRRGSASLWYTTIIPVGFLVGS